MYSRLVNSKLLLLGLLILVACVSCIETYDFSSEIENEESIMVVEAIITNEIKNQEVILTKSFALDTLLYVPEKGAEVTVVDELQNEYQFFEVEDGVYQSFNKFQAVGDRNYKLNIKTRNGKEYVSTSEYLTKETKIDSLYAVRDFNENNEEGVSIYVDSYDATHSSNFYRFEYIEAYKIIAPKWVGDDMFCVPVYFQGNYIGDEFVFEPRPYDQLICYGEDKLDKIVQTNTNSLQEDRLDKHRVRFVNRNDYKLSYRYTIEVKQYVQSLAAYSYYETLNKVSSSESILSQTQTGFIESNISLKKNDSYEKVLGFFEVCSVDSKRIFLNYDDLFLGEQLPPYAVNCVPFNPRPEGLCDALRYNGKKYYDDHIPVYPLVESHVLLVERACGDCTALGETSPPDYWID